MGFNNIIGNNDAKEYLLNIIENKNILQSYLFLGTEGIGKLSIAKEFAKKILCLNESEDQCNCKSCVCFDSNNHADYIILNKPGDTIKIDQIRELTNSIIKRPIISNKKVYIINDSDKMTVEAQNCLLKTLEEPPEFAIIILISSNESNLLNTIKSRCMAIKFKNISDEELEKYAKNNLGYTQITENMLKSFNGSIGKAEIQKENQEKYIEIERIIDDLQRKDIIDIINSAKIIYDKENVYRNLEYMVVCAYSKKDINIKYINCVEKINKCYLRLKNNCNFDMSIDTMLFEMWEELN